MGTQTKRFDAESKIFNCLTTDCELALEIVDIKSAPN